MLLAAGCQRQPLLVSRAADSPPSFVVRSVRVFDAPSAKLMDGLKDVTVRDGRVAAIAPAEGAKRAASDVDGQGGTLLPGLVDLHTHTGSTSFPPWRIGMPDVEANLAAFLYAGVTTVLDLGSLSPEVFRERQRVASGTHLGPRLFVAGPIFTAPGGHPTEVLRAFLPWYLRWYVLPRATREVATPQAAQSAVAALLAEKPDVLKIADDAATGDVPRLAPETMTAVVAAGHAAGIRSIVHIGDSREAIDAVKAGADALAHAPWREEISDAAVAAIAAAHVPVVPTIAVWDLIGTPRASPADFLPIEAEVAAAEVRAAIFEKGPELDAATVAVFHAAAAARAARRANVRKLRAAGVTILPGSDALNPGNLPGAALHLELAKLVEAGMTPGEALRAATLENARFLAGASADFGEVAVGKRADLVLVNGDPTNRIEELGKISRVILGGVWLERRAPSAPSP